MDTLFNNFRKIWSNKEWVVLKWVLVVFVLYFVGYQVGKVVAHITY